MADSENKGTAVGIALQYDNTLIYTSFHIFFQMQAAILGSTHTQTANNQSSVIVPQSNSSHNPAITNLCSLLCIKSPAMIKLVL